MQQIYLVSLTECLLSSCAHLESLLAQRNRSTDSMGARTQARDQKLYNPPSKRVVESSKHLDVSGWLVVVVTHNWKLQKAVIIVIAAE